MTDTKQRILDKALQLFNESGIEYTGMRELAGSLGMRIGNITYYFPTKDDLVFNLTEQYSKVNSEIYQAMAGESLYEKLKKREALLKNQVVYRSLMLSMVHIIEQNPLIAANYQKIAKTRLNDLSDMVSSLTKKKFLILKDEEEHWFLVSACSLMMRFWLSEAALSGKRNQLDQSINHYLKLFAHLFKPYATKKGLRDIEEFVAGLTN
jgi:AcrR family transcriptional regulator